MLLPLSFPTLCWNKVSFTIEIFGVGIRTVECFFVGSIPALGVGYWATTIWSYLLTSSSMEPPSYKRTGLRESEVQILLVCHRWSRAFPLWVEMNKRSLETSGCTCLKFVLCCMQLIVGEIRNAGGLLLPERYHSPQLGAWEGERGGLCWPHCLIWEGKGSESWLRCHCFLLCLLSFSKSSLIMKSFSVCLHAISKDFK